MKRGVGRLVAAACLGVICQDTFAASCHPVAAAPQSLGAADVHGLVARTATVAGLNRKATIAVVDRVGNVLAVYRSGNGNSGFTVTIRSGLVNPANLRSPGLETSGFGASRATCEGEPAACGDQVPQ